MSSRKITRERSAVVQRSIMSKASKVSHSEVDEKRNHFSPTNQRQVKPLTMTVGLGRHRSSLFDEDRSDLQTNPLRKSRSNVSAMTSNSRVVSSPRGVEPYEEEGEWEFVNENRSVQSPRNENEDIGQKENLENEHYTKTVAPTSPTTTTDDSETIIDKAADAADRSLLYLDAQIQNAVLKVSSILNKKD